MGINRETSDQASLRVGPTTLGMVRIYISSETVDLPMDFTPDEAEEIAQELLFAAGEARKSATRPAKGEPGKAGPGKGGGAGRGGKAPRR
jgi:hypothetical protein